MNTKTRKESNINKFLDDNSVSKEDAQHILFVLKKFDDVFSFLDFEQKETELPKQFLDKIKQREHLRKQGRYCEADKIRQELNQKGIILQDNKDFTTSWELKI